MAEIITMPRLSDTMNEGKVSKWYKKIGDFIKEGDIIAEIETDKAIQEFESEYSGFLLYIGVKESEEAKVDEILAIIGNSINEDISHLIKNTDKIIIKTEKIKKIISTDNVSINQNIDLLKNNQIITMPRLSDTMNEGKVSKWYKKIGDFIKEGDIIAEIETDKAIQEFESEYSGFLLYIGVKESEEAKVDEILAIIGSSEHEDVDAILDAYQNSLLNLNSIALLKNDISSNENYCNDNLINKLDNEVDQCFPRILISPLAKKIAKEKNIDISKIVGSGENGRIVKKDVELMLNLHTNSDNVLENSDVFLNKFNIKSKNFETPNSKIRSIIAERILNSKNKAPHYYLITEVNMNHIIDSRLLINTSSNIRISFNDFIIKATALALTQHSQINSSWKEDKIIHHGDINIGVAVAVSEGLMVPVLKNANYLSLHEISNLVKDLVNKARNKSLHIKEMEGSTFSISNLGMFGIECFTSIIHQPNACILSVGSIIEKPIVKMNKILIGNVLKLSLACDHRIVDGAVGAKFLQTLKNYLENPIMMIL